MGASIIPAPTSISGRMEVIDMDNTGGSTSQTTTFGDIVSISINASDAAKYSSFILIAQMEFLFDWCEWKVITDTATVNGQRTLGVDGGTETAGGSEVACALEGTHYTSGSAFDLKLQGRVSGAGRAVYCNSLVLFGVRA